jgi:gamma-glutamyltranspeptidase/glutathione hydrolase
LKGVIIMQFDALFYPYGSRREVVYARHGMVCTSQSLAAQAGLYILREGGNAIDAALATAMALVVLEPVSDKRQAVRHEWQRLVTGIPDL